MQCEARNNDDDYCIILFCDLFSPHFLPLTPFRTFFLSSNVINYHNFCLFSTHYTARVFLAPFITFHFIIFCNSRVWLANKSFDIHFIVITFVQMFLSFAAVRYEFNGKIVISVCVCVFVFLFHEIILMQTFQKRAKKV